MILSRLGRVVHAGRDEMRSHGAGAPEFDHAVAGFGAEGLHQGRVRRFGVGQIVAGIASAGGVLLVWTGISLALRRFANWRRSAPRIVKRAA